MRGLESKSITRVVLFVVACLIQLSGCSPTQNSSPDKEAQPAVSTQETLTEYPLSNGTLQVITAPRCRIRFKQSGVADFVKNLDDVATANVLYTNLHPGDDKVLGPDALIEWSFEDGRHTIWSLSTHPKARITNKFDSSVSHFQISEITAKTFVLSGDVVFSNLGGAHQVIVPMTFAWQKTKFVMIAHKNVHAKTNAELKKLALQCRSIVDDSPGVSVSPELAEAVLTLYADGDEAGSKKLLQYALRKNSARESCWKNLVSAFNDAVQSTAP